MSSLAAIAVRRGYRVTGSDRAESEATDKLAKLGIEITYAHNAENVIGADAVIFTAAVHDDNPEMAKSVELGIPRIKRAEFLGYIMRDYKTRIGVAGMHGKSTTTSMISEVFIKCGAEPTIVNGVKLAMLDGAYLVGSKEHFIFEACEYTDSFLSFFPSIAVVLNIDRDHVDYFESMEQTVESFRKYINLAENAVVNIDNEYMADAIKGYCGNLITVGTEGKEAEYKAENIIYKNGCGEFDFMHNSKKLGRISLSVPGKHEVLDALVSAAVADICGLDFEKCAKALYEFKGANRRFERTGSFNGIDVYDDYAHHPSEIKTTLEGIVQLGYKKVWCIFQPHTYSRTAGLFDEFSRAFDEVDTVIFADIYAARETDTLGVSSKKLAEAAGEHALYIDSFEKIAAYLKENAEPGDLILTMGAGDVYKVGQMLTAQ